MENEAEKQIDLLFLGFLIEEMVVAAGRITWIGKSIFPYCKTLTGKTISIEVESNVKANKNPGIVSDLFFLQYLGFLFDNFFLHCVLFSSLISW